MNTSVERLEGNTVKLTVTVEAAEVDKAIAHAYKTIGSKVKIPGFRPGKAPRAVVDNTVGKEYVLAEATEDVVNVSYPKALDAEKLRPIESPEMDEIDTVVPGEEFTYVAEVEIRPELGLTNLDDLKVQVPSKAASDDEIEMQLNQFRERYATLEPVEGRGVQADDFVLLSFVGTVDGEEYEGNTVDKYLYEMNRGLMPAEFDEGITGLEPGGEAHIEFDIPDTTSNPDFVGKKAGFDVTVHEIKNKILPELDDDFAGNVGGFDTMDELRKNVREGIETQKGYSYDRNVDRALRELIAGRLDGEVPEAMVRSREERLGRDFQQQLESRDMSVADYAAVTGLTPEEIEKDIEDQAKQFVAEELALEALFRQQGYEVTDEELETELEQMAGASDVSKEQMRERWEAMGLTAIIVEEIMHRRAAEWLAENTEIVEVEPSAEGTNNESDLPEAADTFEVEAAAVEADEE